MLISKKLENSINEQVGSEFEASLLYLNVAAYFDSESLPNLAAFFYRQSDEERMHAMKFIHYILETGGHVRIPAIEKQKSDFESAVEAVNLAVQWEKGVTSEINALMNLADEQNDHLSQDFLSWFVTEQLEEESTMGKLLSYVIRSKDNVLFADDYLARNPIVGVGTEASGTE